MAPTDYLQDDLNQVTSREIPDDVDIMGYGVSASSTITVDGYTADRWQKYFDAVLNYTNSTDPVYDEFVVAETGQSSYDRAVFLPEDEEEFTYDADGNLTGDGKWTYTWDAENRLATMETRSDLPMLTWGLDFLKIEFDYDYLGRRVQKRVYKKIVGNPGGPATQGIMEGGTAATTMVTQDSVEGGTVPLYTLITSRQYVWDGWLCIAELIGREDLKRSHTWGVDLSGGQQGAGGVSGLVFLLDRDDTTDEVYHCFYDGNGNLMSLRDDSQAIAAQYDYGPFGELLTARGEYAAENPYRFSTKYVDAETGLHYYGYRYYNSSTGQWLSRDPIGEEGGLNLYGFVGNAPSHSYDALGQEDAPCYDPHIDKRATTAPLLHFARHTFGPTTLTGFFADWNVKIRATASARASADSLKFIMQGSMSYFNARYPEGARLYKASRKLEMDFGVICTETGQPFLNSQTSRQYMEAFGTTKSMLGFEVEMLIKEAGKSLKVQIDVRAVGRLDTFSLKVTPSLGIGEGGLAPGISITPTKTIKRISTRWTTFGPWFWACHECDN